MSPAHITRIGCSRFRLANQAPRFPSFRALPQEEIARISGLKGDENQAARDLGGAAVSVNELELIEVVVCRFEG